MGRIILSLIMVVMALAGTACGGWWQQVPQGNAGMLVDYCAGTTAGKPVMTKVPTATNVYVDWRCQKLVGYPTNDQTLTMVASEKEGQVQGNDAVLVQAGIGGVSMYLDTSVVWAVDQERIGDLFLRRFGMPIDGELNGSITGVVVRPAVRSVMNTVSATYSMDELNGDKKPEYSRQVEDQLRKVLAEDDIILKHFYARGWHAATKEQTDALNGKMTAQQQAQTALFQATKTVAEASARGAAVISEAGAKATANALTSNSPTYDQLTERMRVERWNGVQAPQYIVAGTAPVASPAPK